MSAELFWPVLPRQNEIALVWGDAPADRQAVTIPALRSGYSKYPFRFTSGADTHAGRLEIVGRGTGSFHVGAVSLMPADTSRVFARTLPRCCANSTPACGDCRAEISSPAMTGATLSAIRTTSADHGLCVALRSAE